MSVTLEQISLNDVHHDLVGTLEDLVHTQVSQEPLYWVLFEVPIATMHLESIVDYIKASISR